MILHTPRLTLRGPRATDLDDLYAIYSHPDAMRYWSEPPHADPSVTHAHLDRLIQGFAKRPGYFCLEHNGRVIGNAGLAHSPEVGFILHPDHHRQGFMTEAMQAIIPHLWSITDLPALTADADPLNAASVGFLTSLGFQETHRAANTFCVNGVWSDSVYFALQRPS